MYTTGVCNAAPCQSRYLGLEGIHVTATTTTTTLGRGSDKGQERGAERKNRSRTKAEELGVGTELHLFHLDAAERLPTSRYVPSHNSRAGRDQGFATVPRFTGSHTHARQLDQVDSSFEAITSRYCRVQALDDLLVVVEEELPREYERELKNCTRKVYRAREIRHGSGGRSPRRRSDPRRSPAGRHGIRIAKDTLGEGIYAGNACAPRTTATSCGSISSRWTTREERRKRSRRGREER